MRRPFYAAFAKGVLSGIILVSPAHEQPRPFLPPHDSSLYGLDGLGFGFGLFFIFC
jgi:hypothetical protein